MKDFNKLVIEGLNGRRSYDLKLFMLPYKPILFTDARFPEVSDSSRLSNLLLDNYHSEEEFSELFSDLKEGRIPDVEFNERSKIFTEVLPINFFNEISLLNGTLGDESFFSPSQKFVMKFIQRTLYEKKDDTNYQKLLEYFADRIMPQNQLNAKLFKFCGEITFERTKKIGVFTYDNHIEIYDRESLFTSQQTIAIQNLPKQNKLWEKTRSEISNGINSPLVAVFRSFSALTSFETLPVDIYSGFINYFTSPDMQIVSQILSKNIENIEFPLTIIFMHKNLHRRLLKFCIYREVFATTEPSHLMRMNSQDVKIVVVFLTEQIKALIDPAINSIKVEICKHSNFDFTLNDQSTIESFKKLTDIFINGFLKILPVIPSSIRYVCSIINEASKVKFKSLSFKGVFMAFFFRVIFPLLCQPCPTDPPGLKVDIKKMAHFGKIMTSIFLAEQAQLSHFSEIASIHEDDINAIFDRLTDCPEPYDIIETPSYRTACLMVDKIRKKCYKKTANLLVETNKHSAVLMQWLDLMKNIDVDDS